MTDDELLRSTLAAVAPGTDLRDGLERILRGRTGALIVLGHDKLEAGGIKPLDQAPLASTQGSFEYRGVLSRDEASTGSGLRVPTRARAAARGAAAHR